MKKLLILFVVLNMGFWGFAEEKAVNNTDSFKKLNEKCEKFKGSQKYGEYYGEAFLYYCLNPENEKDVLYLIGDALYQMGAYFRSENIYGKILERNSGDETAVRALDDLTKRLKNINSKINEKTKLAESGNKVAENYASLTGIYIGLKEYSKASNVLSKALNADKKNFFVSLMNGAFQDRLIKPTGQAIKISSQAGDMVSEGNVNQGLRMYRQALSLSIVSPFVYLNLADSLLHLNNYKGAVIALEEAYVVHPEVSNAFEIGNIYLFLGNYKFAYKYYNLALAGDFKAPKIMLNAAKCLEKLGNLEKANALRVKAYELNPKLKNSNNKEVIVRGVTLK